MNTYYVPSTVLGAELLGVDKIDKILALMELIF